MKFNLDQALPIFIQEAKELLQSMEAALLILEGNPNDTDTIDEVFRAAHTIKGSAGLFGLEPIVSFTHVLEDVLDRLREGKIKPEQGLIALLLESGDHLKDLLRVFVIEAGELNVREQQRELSLREQLKTYQSAQHNINSAQTENLTPVHMVGGEGLVRSSVWHISLRFGPDVFRNGMDPQSFLRYLASFGSLVSVTTLCDAMPEASTMDAETCYLGFEIEFDADVEKQKIADVFNFVRDDCVVHILPPHSKIADYLKLIQKLPEEDSRLGEILVNSGALTADELAQGLSEQHAKFISSGEFARIGDILVEQRAVEPSLVQAALDKQTRIKDQKIKENQFIRVQADKLDYLINLIGELVIAGAGANLLARQSQDGAFYEATSAVSDLVEEIRDGALRLRMVAIGDTFNRFHRIVRDLSHELGKNVELHIHGAETEVDKTLVEKISDPLMHLMRNSMDHGIEAPDMRILAGKPIKGKLTLNAYHDSGSIVIEITDDGRGLNRERILQKAIERGLVSASATLSDTDIYKLIFEPGFSTAESITSVSGRGVGMDVVKRNIASLRGTIELDSKPGQGTAVYIRLPLTLAIIDGFLIGVGQASYVVPLDMVQECIELNNDQSKSVHQQHYLNLRGEVLPLIFLRSQFHLDEARSRRENVVVVRCAGRKAGLVVDELQGEFQTVIKPLGKLFGGLRGISGSTILGNGAVALILDVPVLIEQIVQQEIQVTHAHHNYLSNRLSLQ
ncbi:MAG: chemotaxis protein CheA [Moraxellaceae bacterium]|nr:MAG: chemotaxis protein CheA [Moraxellaceae bacterium]